MPKWVLNPRDSRGTSCALLGVILLLALAGCSGIDDTEPSQEAVTKALPPATEPAATTEQAKPVLFLDTSASMRGFVHAPNSSFLRVVNEIYRQTAQIYKDQEMWAVSSDRAPIKNFSYIQDESNYSGGDTPLAKIIRELATKVSEGKSVIFASDFVQSEGVKDVKDLSNAVMDLARGSMDVDTPAADSPKSAPHHVSLALLAFRSAFDGKYYVEARQKGEFLARLPQNDQGRPFYVLVAAPSAAAMDDMKRTVLRELMPATPGSTPLASGSEPMAALNIFSPTDPPIHVEPKWSFPADAATQWDIFRHAPTASAPDVFTLGHCAGVTCPLDLVFNVAEKLSVKSADDFVAQVDCAAFGTGKPHQSARASWQPHIKKEKVAARGKRPAGLSYRVTYLLPKPNAKEWSAIRVNLSAGRGNLAAPGWVSDWSTQDDSSIANIGRTLNLDAVVGAMIHEISEKQIFFSHTILVGRK